MSESISEGKPAESVEEPAEAFEELWKIHRRACRGCRRACRIRRGCRSCSSKRMSPYLGPHLQENGGQIIVRALEKIREGWSVILGIFYGEPECRSHLVCSSDSRNSLESKGLIIPSKMEPRKKDSRFCNNVPFPL